MLAPLEHSVQRKGNARRGFVGREVGRGGNDRCCSMEEDEGLKKSECKKFRDSDSNPYVYILSFSVILPSPHEVTTVRYPILLSFPPVSQFLYTVYSSIFISNIQRQCHHRTSSKK